MSRVILVLGLSCLLAACSNQSSTPNAPSITSSGNGNAVSVGSGSGAGPGFAAPFGFPASLQRDAFPASVTLDGIVAVNFGRCLSGLHDAWCQSAARMGRQEVGAAPATAPGAPGTLSSTVSGNSVTLNWSAPSSGDPVVTFVIEAGSGSGLTNLANVPTNSTATTFSANGVASGSYYVRVRAQNSAGTSPPSNEILLIVGSTGCISAPGAPPGLASSVSGSTVSLAWGVSSGSPTTYIVEAGSSSGAANLANSNLGSTATAFTATGVGAGTYYVRVRARNACGTSAASNEVVIVVGSSAGVVITGWSARLSISIVGGSYVTSGEIDMTVNTPLLGLYRGEFASYGKVGAAQRFVAPTRNLAFFVFTITPLCPDLHGTVPLNLYDDDHGGAFVASIAATLRGSGCAFNP